MVLCSEVLKNVIKNERLHEKYMIFDIVPFCLSFGHLSFCYGPKFTSHLVLKIIYRVTMLGRKGRKRLFYGIPYLTFSSSLCN